MLKSLLVLLLTACLGCTFSAGFIRSGAESAGPFGVDGIEVRTCRHRLSENPVLAGIKHLNRLDQVLASAELEQGITEGLMLSQKGLAIEGTKSNILFFEDDGIVSPDTRLCGVDGVARSYIFDSAAQLGLNTRLANILPSSISEFKGMAVTNSVLGVWPVCRLDGVDLPISPIVCDLQRLLNKQLNYEYKV